MVTPTQPVAKPTTSVFSEQRAQAVATYFQGRGVPASRLSTQGYGESAPRASNATAAGRQLNRRVEVLLRPREQ